jgi:F0F1-type ATP synthase assembly protein I
VIRLLFATVIGAWFVWLVVRKVNNPACWTIRSLAAKVRRPYRWAIGIHSVLVLVTVACMRGRQTELGPAHMVGLACYDLPAMMAAAFLLPMENVPGNALRVFSWTAACLAFGAIQWTSVVWIFIRLNRLSKVPNPYLPNTKRDGSD